MDEISIDQAIAAVRLHELHQAGVITNFPPSIDVERCRRIVGLVARIKVHAARYHLSLFGSWAAETSPAIAALNAAQVRVSAAHVLRLMGGDN